MDIVGLGNTANIRIIKAGVDTTKNNPTNRHLFNCTNSDSYIEVTIRNLYLDASQKIAI